jgi:aspartate dehydrogenase
VPRPKPTVRVPARTRIGLIGLGHIGGLIAGLARASPEDFELVGALVAGGDRPRPVGGPPLVPDLPTLLRNRPDVVIECAGQSALRTHGPGVLKAGIDLVPSAVGLFADDAALRSFCEAAAGGGAAIRLASGAMPAIDGLHGARRLGLDEVRYRSIMPSAAWGEHLQHAAPDGELPRQDDGLMLVFRGNAREAALRFPRHANVTATISLAGIGFERTRVELLADPQAEGNRHELQASGAFGRLSAVVQGHRIAPGTSSTRLVAGSLLAAATGTGCPVVRYVTPTSAPSA